MNNWTTIPTKEKINKTLVSLKKRNIDSYFVEKSEEAKNKVLELLPKGARVLSGQSETLKKIGLSELIDNSGEFISVRKEYMTFDYEKEKDKIRISRSTPDIIVGSVHAVTKNGEVLIASNTGSQLASYVAGAGKVIWVVGAQKIVENVDEGIKRIYDYVLPLESKRLKKLYGVPSNVSKLLIYNKETEVKRVILIIVNEVLGF